MSVEPDTSALVTMLQLKNVPQIIYRGFNTQQSTLNSDSINYKRLKSEDLGRFSTIFTYANTCSNMSINIHNLHSKFQIKP
ncbi:BnaC04g08720D [Brassica napus]|uniref:Uncharacterized protein n=2 Tax=Brassica TaxID=3705 RepID=A0A0D3BRH7_BRAOL|nr:unnamed protein product [Brassica napus]CDY33167.1 BnaC04g08720D [Brassica napus]